MKNFSFSSIKSFFTYGHQIKPTRDWFVLLSIFALLLAGSLAWNVWLFSEVTRGQKIGNVAPTTPVEIKLTQVKTLFADRASERARYMSEYKFVDPSL